MLLVRGAGTVGRQKLGTSRQTRMFTSTLKKASYKITYLVIAHAPKIIHLSTIYLALKVFFQVVLFFLKARISLDVVIKHNKIDNDECVLMFALCTCILGQLTSFRSITLIH